jgi:predicted NUDIX family phosphoesterase
MTKEIIEVKAEETVETVETEKIVVLPDLFAPTNDMIPVNTTFSETICKRGFGWDEMSFPYLLRVVERDQAEIVPTPGEEKARQLIANTMVFELPMDVYTHISYEKAVSSIPETLDNLMALIKEHATLLCAVRLKGSGEARLHNKLSCAFGGHSDVIDYATAQVVLDQAKDKEDERKILTNFLDYTIRFGCIRELEEELCVGAKTEANEQLWKQAIRTSVIPFGIINSSENAVESVHMGMINVLAVPDRFNLQVKETDKLEMRRFKFEDLTNSEVFKDYQIETWTEISFKENLMNMYALAILRSI